MLAFSSQLYITDTQVWIQILKVLFPYKGIKYLVKNASVLFSGGLLFFSSDIWSPYHTFLQRQRAGGAEVHSKLTLLILLWEWSGSATCLPWWGACPWPWMSLPTDSKAVTSRPSPLQLNLRHSWPWKETRSLNEVQANERVGMTKETSLDIVRDRNWPVSG